MRTRDLGFGTLRPWPPQRCFKTARMSIYGITVILGGSNMYVAICEATRKAMIVDFADSNAARWGRSLQQMKAQVELVVQTHGQDTQGMGLSTLKRLSFFSPSTKIMGHPAESSLLHDIDAPLEDNKTLNVGELVFKCLHIPGPSVGHCAFYEKSEGVAFTGDIITRGGQMTRAIQDPKAMKESLARLVREIPETTLLFPGHFGLTTMGAERRNNPNLMGLNGPPLLVPRELPDHHHEVDRKRKIKRWIIM
jgi:hydroxyacylglutathione hydrolase